MMPGRGYTAKTGYRYGFGGQERSDEIKGEGNSYTAEFWQYDPKIARRWNLDPIVKPYEGPYAVIANNPIWFNDPKGADTVTFTKTSWHRNGVSKHESIDKVQGEGGSIDIKTAPGLDVFYYNETYTEYDENGKGTTTTNTTQFFPRENKHSGISSTSYFLGLFSSEDDDRLALAKLAPKSLLNYLENKSVNFDFEQTNAYRTSKALSGDYKLFQVLKTLEEATVSYYGFSAGSRALSALRVASSEETLFNFSVKALEHMNNPGRKVPVQILDDVIKNSQGFVDPRGSRALMYYEQIFKNGKAYNLEVLYDKATNSIWHFQYGRGAMGPLGAIPK